MNDEPQLLPRLTEQSALERRLAGRILKLNPGLGNASVEMAASLADSGLPPASATLLLLAVYTPTDVLGRGQSTRAKWFISAVRNRYGHKLEKIKGDVKQFRNFISDIEEVSEMRDILNGEGLGISFESAFLLWEMGLNADSALAVIDETCSDSMSRKLATALLVRAATCVKAGHFMELETAVDAMRFGYQYDHTN